MANYVCSELDLNVDTGVVTCKTWVAYQQPVNTSPAVTPEVAQIVGGWLFVCFCACLGYLIITKALKIA